VPGPLPISAYPPTDWSKGEIGVATDIRTLDDKNFCEYTFRVPSPARRT
jgi:hypothetical protein